MARLGRQIKAGVDFSPHCEQTAIRSLQIEILRTNQVEVAGQQVNRSRRLETKRGLKHVVFTRTLGLGIPVRVRGACGGYATAGEGIHVSG